MNANEDPHYGTLYLGHGEIKKAVSLPEEFRDGGVIDFGKFDILGWQWNGDVHWLADVYEVDMYEVDGWMEYWHRDVL